MGARDPPFPNVVGVAVRSSGRRASAIENTTLEGCGPRGAGFAHRWLELAGPRRGLLMRATQSFASRGEERGVGGEVGVRAAAHANRVAEEEDVGQGRARHWYLSGSRRRRLG